MPYRNILLIDDDVDDQEIFATALERIPAGALFLAMGDAREALKKLMAKELTPDVIFLDLNMPVMSGQQFLLEIQKNKLPGDIPVIVFSTSSHAPTIALIRELGARDFITKPNKFDDLIAILKSIIV